MTGHDSAHFEVRLLSDGSVAVASRAIVAFYPAVGWTSAFTRHLHRGYFELVKVSRKTG